MSGGSFVRVLATLALVGVLVLIGVGIYNAGVSDGVSAGIPQQGAAVASGAPVVVYPGPYIGHGWGWGAGFGFFGFFFWIRGIFLIFALVRAAFGFGRGRGHGGWGHSGRYGGQDHLEDWHRRAHEPGSGPSAGSSAPPA